MFRLYVLRDFGDGFEKEYMSETVVVFVIISILVTSFPTHMSRAAVWTAVRPSISVIFIDFCMCNH